MDVSELREICEEVTREGIERFDVMIGIVSHIYDDTYEIFPHRI